MAESAVQIFEQNLFLKIMYNNRMVKSIFHFSVQKFEPEGVYWIGIFD